MKRPIDLGEADPRPYVRLAVHLRKQILNGELASGGAVPSITTFSRELGYARQTCGRAMQLLEHEGLLLRVPGSATTSRGPRNVYASLINSKPSALRRQRELWQTLWGKCGLDHGLTVAVAERLLGSVTKISRLETESRPLGMR